MGKTLHDIKRSLDENVGKRITLTTNGGRRKVVERSGMLTETYPSVFVVQLDRDKHSIERVSYSYTDVLTKTVQLALCDESDSVHA
ncbi:uncharacterized protein Veg [Salsuginibacillus halophilus]|uniref:Uncharacterized protein Veg n=1 Tax=Salsuginibacillus halophilus TaxID=517424 RepID=A0A2P8H7P8_9BACI|nr:Veg family protein [Salsuginibacillus halophilus]PSL42248.1 uncharacterized protein Veg [Salsuginibacillus halophilus]